MSRKDQLHSYQFLVQRRLAALVTRETDPAQSPLRRGVGAIFGGIMIAVLLGAVFGIYGLLTKTGSTDWRADGSVVIEKETGAAFVYFDGRLHPTLNYSSALLAAGKPGPAVFRVPRNSLAGVPRGRTLGIPGAPDSLASTDRMMGLPWTLCAVAGVDEAGNTTSRVTLMVGAAPPDARPVAGDEGLLVKSDSADSTYLVWRNHRYALKNPDVIVPALFGATVAPVAAGDAWLNALPAGVDIGPISIASGGAPSATIPNLDVGDLLVADTGSGPQHYLVLDDGLAPITELQKNIVAAQSSVRTLQTTVAEAAALPRSGQLAQTAGDERVPQAPPNLVQPASTEPLCVKTSDARLTPEVLVGGGDALSETATSAGRPAGVGTGVADSIMVPPGYGAVIRSVVTPGAGTGAYYMVTDQGIRYAVPSSLALQMLGYSPEDAVDVPASLVSRIPAGPALDPAAAAFPVG